MKGLGKPWVWLLALGLGCLTASAHTDTMLELKGGKLVTREGMADAYKVPEEYLPMEFDAATHRVRIGKREMTLISFFSDLFPKEGKGKVRFSTSWYHDTDSDNSLPPYLAIRVEPEGRQFDFTLLLNMKDLSVIKFDLNLDIGGGEWRWMPVNLGPWEKEIRESIKVVKEK